MEFSLIQQLLSTENFTLSIHIVSVIASEVTLTVAKGEFSALFVAVRWSLDF